MARVYDEITDHLRGWVARQSMFFVATAPLAADGMVNVSPKGTRGTFRVVDAHTFAYVDLTGSGIETVAHLRENGRICVMFCAFDGPPRIVRLHGRGEVLAAEDPGDGVRGAIRVHVDRVSDSCGYGVPLMEYVGERPQREAWLANKGADGVREYVGEKNAVSIDGLRALGSG
jgi:hypothetical protein